VQERSPTAGEAPRAIRKIGNGGAVGDGVEPRLDPNRDPRFARGAWPVDNRPDPYKAHAAALAALACAVAVYCLVRSQPPAILEPLHHGVIPALALQGIFGSAPSLLYTLAMALVLGTVAGTRRAATAHVLQWTALAMVFELLQHPAFARPVAAWLVANLPDSAWGVTRDYWLRGIFDYVDLLATLLGGMLGLLLLESFGRSVAHEYQD